MGPVGFDLGKLPIRVTRKEKLHHHKKQTGVLPVKREDARWLNLRIDYGPYGDQKSVGATSDKLANVAAGTFGSVSTVCPL